jgi:hypothetical protein
MTRVDPGGGGDTVGIDPQKLQDMTSTMSKSSGNAMGLVSYYISQMSRAGLDTSSLTKASQDLTWAQDQVPMLNRRQTLAQTMAQQLPGTAMVSAGADSLGNFATNQAAAAAAQQDGKNFQNGNLTVDQLYQKMAANQNDSAYCTALMQALGADGLRQIEQYPPYNPNDPSGTQNRSVLAQVVAAAMYNGVTFAESGYNPKYGNIGKEDPALLAPLLAWANFPPQVLADLGTSCLAPGEYQYGNQVWQALAASPAGATLFLHQNMSYLPDWMAGNSDHRGGLPDFQAANFAQVVAAGTMGGYGADQNMAAQNTTQLIQYYASNPGNNTHSEIQAVFGQVIQHYWSDLQYAVTDPAPANLGAGHVNVSADQWKAFVGQAMQNATAGGNLLAFSGVQAKVLATGNPNNPEAQHASGLINGFFGSEALTVYQQMLKNNGDQAKAWQVQVVNQINTVLGTGIDVVANPTGAAATLVKAAVKDVLGLFVAGVVNINSGQGPKSPQIATWQNEWQQAVAETYQQDNGLGNPQQYAQTYNAKPFLTTDGYLVSNPSSQQSQAYNAWLQDQAVAQQSNQRFLNLDQGRLDGMTG